MPKIMNGRLQDKHDIETNWNKATKFIPLIAETIVYDPDENHNVPRFKIGDGVTPVTELPFLKTQTQGGVGESNIVNGEIFNDYENNQASGDYSHAEGTNTRSIGSDAHAEGKRTVALTNHTHAEGYGSIIPDEDTLNAWYEGLEGDTPGATATEIKETWINGYGEEKKKFNMAAYGPAHTEGENCLAYGEASHAEGYYTIAGYRSHAEGDNTQATGNISHAEGKLTVAAGQYSHSEGKQTQANSDYAHAEGSSTIVSGLAGHAEGFSTQAIANYTHAEGSSTIASATNAHAEGASTQASGAYSHAEGYNTKAIGGYSHAEGADTQAKYKAHAEGSHSKALGEISHAEGLLNTASGNQSHAEGEYNEASGQSSHAEGQNNKALHAASHVGGRYNTTTRNYQTVLGEYANPSSTGLFAVGNGNASTLEKISEEQKSQGPIQGITYYFWDKTIADVSNGFLTSRDYYVMVDGKRNAFEVLEDGSATVIAQGDTDNSVIIKSTLDRVKDSLSLVDLDRAQIDANTVEINNFVENLNGSSFAASKTDYSDSIVYQTTTPSDFIGRNSDSGFANDDEYGAGGLWLNLPLEEKQLIANNALIKYKILWTISWPYRDQAGKQVYFELKAKSHLAGLNRFKDPAYVLNETHLRIPTHFNVPKTINGYNRVEEPFDWSEFPEWKLRLDSLYFEIVKPIEQ